MRVLQIDKTLEFRVLWLLIVVLCSSIAMHGDVLVYSFHVVCPKNAVSCN